MTASCALWWNISLVAEERRLNWTGRVLKERSSLYSAGLTSLWISTYCSLCKSCLPPKPHLFWTEKRELKWEQIKEEISVLLPSIFWENPRKGLTWSFLTLALPCCSCCTCRELTSGRGQCWMFLKIHSMLLWDTEEKTQALNSLLERKVCKHL